MSKMSLLTMNNHKRRYTCRLATKKDVLSHARRVTTSASTRCRHWKFPMEYHKCFPRYKAGTDVNARRLNRRTFPRCRHHNARAHNNLFLPFCRTEKRRTGVLSRHDFPRTVLFWCCDAVRVTNMCVYSSRRMKTGLWRNWSKMRPVLSVLLENCLVSPKDTDHSCAQWRCTTMLNLQRTRIFARRRWMHKTDKYDDLYQSAMFELRVETQQVRWK